MSPNLWLGASSLISLLSVHSAFSAQFEGDTDRIIPKRRHIVTVSFMPQEEGRCEAALELKFHDHVRRTNFVIKRTLSGWAKRPINELGREPNGFVRALRSRPINRQGVHSSISADDEEEGEEFWTPVYPSRMRKAYTSASSSAGARMVPLPLQRLHSPSS